MSGWIKLHRKFLKWEWYDDVNTCRLFIHILLTANYEDKKWHGIVIKRGQKLTSTISLSKEVRLSRQVVRTSLERLKSTNEITSKTTSKNTLLTVVKYEEYQGGTEELTTKLTTNLTNKQPTTNQQLTTTKERKKEKNIKNQEAILDFDINKLLDDGSRLRAKSAAPGWDIYYLIPKYNEFISSVGVPNNPVGSFIGWCASYTKGKQL